MPVLEPPVKVGEKYDVKIEATASNTEGLTRIKGFLVFVQGAKIGEEARVEITEISKRFAYAKKI